MSTTLAELRRAIEALPPGAGVSLSREYLLEVLPSGSARAVGEGAELTIGEVAGKFDRSVSTVRGWLEAARFPGAYKLRGRAWRIPEGALELFREAQRTGAPAARASRLQRGQSIADWRKVRPGAP